ncbi:UNVERIFIED_CONTAM: hypothetical protein RMT77_017313 [Armadillidium vulgare]
MNRGGRLKDLAWGEFESVNALENGKTVKKRKCNHCSNLVSNKIERVRAHLGKCDQYKLIGQSEGSSDDGDVEMATGFSPAPAVPVGQNRSRSRSQSPVSVEPRSVSPATSIRTPTPTPKSKWTKCCINAGDYCNQASEDRQFCDLNTTKTKSSFGFAVYEPFFVCNIPFSAAEDSKMKKLFLPTSFETPA